MTSRPGKAFATFFGCFLVKGIHLIIRIVDSFPNQVVKPSSCLETWELRPRMEKRWGRDWLGYLTGPCLFPCPNMLVYWIHSRWASGAVSTFVRLHNPVLPTLKFTADRNGCKSENIGQNIFYCSAPAPAHQPLYDSTEWEVKHALDIEAAQHRHEI